MLTKIRNALALTLALTLSGIPAASGAAFQYGGLRLDIQSTAAAGATTTLTAASKQVQRITGTASQTVKMPDPATLRPGYWFEIISQTAGVVSVVDNLGAAVSSLNTGHAVRFYLAENNTWNAFAGAGAGGGTLTRNITQTAHGLVAGQVVRHDGTQYVLAQADQDANAEVYGVVSRVIDANTFVLTTAGYVTGLSGLTAGTGYFLSATAAGAITATSPTAVGQVSKPVLLADSSSSAFIIPSRGIVINPAGGGGGVDKTAFSATTPLAYDNVAGVFSLTTVPVTLGGTGATDKTTAFKNLAPTCNAGEIIKYDGTANTFVCAAAAVGDNYVTQNYTNTQFGQEWVGAVKIYGCSTAWSQSNSGAYANYTALPTGCQYQIISGSTGISAPDTMIAGFKLTGKGGQYRIEGAGTAGVAAGNVHAFFRYSDGTISSNEDNDFVTGGGSLYGPPIQGVLNYTGSAPVNKTIQVQYRTSGTNVAEIYANAASATPTGANYTYTFNVYRMNTAAQNSAIATVVNGDGLAGTDWQDYSMPITAVTTNPTLGTTTTNKASWRRVGQNMEITYDLALTGAGTAGNGLYLFGLPPGYAIDQSIRANVNNGVGYGTKVGEFQIQDSNNRASGDVLIYDNNRVSLRGKYSSSTNASNTVWDVAIGSGSYQFTNVPENLTLKFSVPIQGWSSNVTMAKSKAFYISEKPLTRVTATPANLGEYRAYVQGTGASGTDTNPAALPSATDGFRIYTVPYGTAGTSGQPNRYEVFVGRNKKVDLQVFTNASRTGLIDAGYFAYGNVNGSEGVRRSYDPTTGVMIVDTIPSDTGLTAFNRIGRPLAYNGAASPGVITNGYFDILVAEKSQVVGVERGDLAAAQITPFITEWKEYPLTIGATTTAPTVGTTTLNKAQWRRSGADTIDVKYDLVQTAAGSGGSGNYLFPLPPQFTIDTNKQQVGYGAQVGTGYISQVADGLAPSSSPLTVHVSDSGRVVLTVMLNSAQGSNSQTPVGSGFYNIAGAANSKISFTYTVPVTQYQGAQSATFITKDPVTSVAAQPLTLVSNFATPCVPYTYRNFTRNANVYTYTDAAPAVPPSAANGFVINGAVFANNTANARVEVCLGQQKAVEFKAWNGAGRAGVIDTAHLYYGTAVEQGVIWAYDKTTGIAYVDAGSNANGITTRTLGLYQGPGGSNLGTSAGYFDLFVYDNPVAAGYTVAQHAVFLSTGNGNGSASTNVKRFGNSSVKGDALSYSDSATLGAGITANRDGLLTLTYLDWSNNTGDYIQGFSKNTTQGATGINLVTDGSRLTMQTIRQSTFGNLSWTGYVSKGDVIRPHNNNVTYPNAGEGMLLAVMAPTPFEVAGGAGSNVSSPGGQEVVARVRVNSACQITSQSGTWAAYSSGTSSATGCIVSYAASNTFAAEPSCTCSAAYQTQDQWCTAQANATSKTIYMGTRYVAGTGTTSAQVDMICVGPKGN